MDDTLIYVKTLTGERAVMERTRLVQRNLRMVLILVERHSDVADLKAKIGGSVIVETALLELEQMGLIELLDNKRRDDRPPVIDESSPATFTPSDLAIAAEPDSALATLETPAEEPLAVDTIFEPFEAVAAELKNGTNGARNELAPAAESLEPPPSAELERSSLTTRLRAWRERREASREERQFEKVYREEPTGPIDFKALSQRGKNGRAVRWWVVALPGLFIALPLLALLFPYGSYAPEIEAAVANALHSPVRIEAIRFSFTPYPNLTLQRIEVGGNKPYATIGEARLVPNPLSIWSSAPTLQFVELAQVRLHSAGIDRTAQWLSGGNGDWSGWRVHRGRVNGLSIELGDKVVGELAGDLVFEADGILTKVLLRSETMRIEAVPAGKLFRLALASDALTLPSQPVVKISDFAGAGELTPQQLRLTEINAHFYDGRLDGKMTIDWSAGASFVGDFEIKRADMGKLLAALSTDSSFAGDVMGKAHIEALAPTLNSPVNDLRIDGSFVGQRVVIERFGLVDAVIARGREPTRSGTTRLDNLGGTLQCDRSACRIGNLTMTSGVMRASGQATISRSSGKLDGALQVELMRNASDINTSVLLQGSLGYPEVKRR